jgi:hypothetical protein
MNETASSTNPTLVPNQTEPDTGIGWASDVIHIVLDGGDEYSFSTSAVDFNTNNLTDVGQITSNKLIHKVIPEKSVPDNSATSVFRIETTNESGDDDGGSYVCKVYALISHPGASDSPHSASKGFEAVFCRAVRNDGTGANSTVTEIAETASAATTSSERDITTVTLSVVETSEYQIDVQFLVDLTGSSAQSTARVTCLVELIYYQFTTAPTITAL